jgi:hypothetical protein
MTIRHPIQKILLSALLAAAAATPAMAQISININLAPPQPQYEAVPVLAPSQVWAPGYWAWNGERHVWVRGRPIASREGHRWAPDHWEQRGNGYYRQPGYWVRDVNYVYLRDKKFKHEKHEKYEDKHEKYEDKREKHEYKQEKREHKGKGKDHDD